MKNFLFGFICFTMFFDLKLVFFRREFFETLVSPKFVSRNLKEDIHDF